MNKTYIETLKGSLVQGQSNQELSFKITNQDETTFVSKKSDSLSLVISLGTPDKVLAIPAVTNYLGNLTFIVTELPPVKGTYLAEIVLTDSQEEQAIYPHSGYLEVSVN